MSAGVGELLVSLSGLLVSVPDELLVSVLDRLLVSVLDWLRVSVPDSPVPECSLREMTLLNS